MLKYITATLVEGNRENRVRLLTFQKNEKPPLQ